jgi:Tfp pilus assembly protein PilV
MKYTHYRKAFSMLTAIIVIVLMSTVALLIMNMSGKLVKETTAQYQREQAILLANSYTEYAIMAVTANNRAVNCLQTIQGAMGDATIANPNNGYRIRTQIAYIGTAAVIGTCAGTRKLGIHTNTDLPLTIIVDTYVDYNDLDNPGAPNMTYHRRTVQKI